MPESGGGGEGPPGPRPFWSGNLTFGLVSVPVRLFAATRSGRGSLRMVAEDGTPLSQQYVSSGDGRPLARDEIVRGYDVSEAGDDSEWVVVTEEELEGLQPEKSREIDLRRFVPVEDLDPVFFERAYFLVPAEGATKAYRLLARVMEDTGRAGVATFVMRSREYLVAIVARDGILRAETLRFHDEIRSPADVGLEAPDEAPPELVDELVAAVEARAEAELDQGEMEDEGADALEALVEAKLRRDEDVAAVPDSAPKERGADDGKVVDLLEVLRRSLEA